ncbi:MAG: putative malonic semialdehyde reductase RutE [Chlamydiae bacterium]|nr:putative malonic semialdehyde reductase RutE [Chlamydiota bacterium]
MPDKKTLDLLFTEARTHTHWQDKDVPEALLKQLYDLAKMGPTSANCQPMRIVFVKSKEQKVVLEPLLVESNRRKMMEAPVCAIVAFDLLFTEHIESLYPKKGIRAYFEGDPDLQAFEAFRSGTLQGGYFILAARLLGLDCGPMAGFDKGAVDQTFFKDERFKTNFLCNLGYGDFSKLHPRNPRLNFNEACQII